MIDKGGILVIDDFIDKDYQEDIKDVLLGKEEWGDLLFPWHYIDDVTAAFEDDNQGRPGLSHVYVEYNDDKTSDIVSDFHDLFIPLLELACGTLEVPTAKILQGRSFMQFPLNLQSDEDDTPHIDLDEGERHIVVYIMLKIVMEIQLFIIKGLNQILILLNKKLHLNREE